jgi:hypothetical protein
MRALKEFEWEVKNAMTRALELQGKSRTEPSA